MEAPLQTSRSPEFGPLFAVGWVAYTVDPSVEHATGGDDEHVQSSSSTWSTVSSLQGMVSKYLRMGCDCTPQGMTQ